jgi:hypothetical protein
MDYSLHHIKKETPAGATSLDRLYSREAIKDATLASALAKIGAFKTQPSGTIIPAGTTRQPLPYTAPAVKIAHAPVRVPDAILFPSLEARAEAQSAADARLAAVRASSVEQLAPSYETQAAVIRGGGSSRSFPQDVVKYYAEQWAYATDGGYKQELMSVGAKHKTDLEDGIRALDQAIYILRMQTAEDVDELPALYDPTFSYQRSGPAFTPSVQEALESVWSEEDHLTSAAIAFFEKDMVAKQTELAALSPPAPSAPVGVPAPAPASPKILGIDQNTFLLGALAAGVGYYLYQRGG